MPKSDEMDLGRPVRHERPRRRSGLKHAPELAGAHVEADVRRPCAHCGREVELKVEGEAAPMLARIIEAQLAGDVPVECEECMAARDEEASAVAEAEQREARIETRRRAAAMPRKWTGARFGDLDVDDGNRRALELAAEWAAGGSKGLVLWGLVGRGKTHIAAAAANERLLRAPVRWLPVAELLLDLRMPFDSPEYARAVRKLEASGSKAALVLDDLDKLKPSEHAVQPLYVAVNAWIEAGLPLLVTLNRDLDELSAWLPDTFGDAIASRLAGYCRVREVAGVDRRMR